MGGEPQGPGQPGTRWRQARWLEPAWDRSGAPLKIKSPSGGNKHLFEIKIQKQNISIIAIGGRDSGRNPTHVLVMG